MWLSLDGRMANGAAALPVVYGKPEEIREIQP